MITRITGIAAVVGLVSVGAFGVLLATRLGNYRGKAKRRLHRRLSVFVVTAVAVHIGAALLDRNHVPPYAVVVPFVSPVRAMAAGTGALAMWGVLLIALTSAARRSLKRSWRLVHHAAYPTAGVALAHSWLGSDRARLVTAVTLGLALLVIRSTYPGRRDKRNRRTRPSAVPGPGPASGTGTWGRRAEDRIRVVTGARTPVAPVTPESDEVASSR